MEWRGLTDVKCCHYKCQLATVVYTVQRLSTTKREMSHDRRGPELSIELADNGEWRIWKLDIVRA